MYRVCVKYFLAVKSFVLVVVAGICIPATTSAQRVIDFNLSVIDTVDYCGDKTLIAVVNVGAIQKTDSLLLFDIPFEYDNSRLVFERPLWAGTLSENLEIKEYGKPEPNIARVYAFNVLRFINGNLPLVAVQFRYKSTQCTGYAGEIRIGSSIEVNTEAKLSVGKLGSAVVQTLIKDKPDRSLKIEFSNHTISFTKAAEEKEVQASLTFPVTANMTTAHIALNIDTNEVVLASAQSLTNDVIVSKTEATGTGYVLSVTRDDQKVLISPLVLRCTLRRKKDKEYNGKIAISLLNTNPCVCITRTVGDSAILKATMPTVNVEPDQNYGCVVRTDGDVWELQSTDNAVQNIMVVDVLGRVRYQEIITAPTRVHRINHRELEEGVYIVIVGDTQHKQEIIKATK